MRNCKVCALLAILAVLVPPAQARLLNVPDEYETIQSALDSAEAGDTVLVQPGTYDENISLTTSGIVVGSLMLTTNNPAYIDSTIIDGGGRDCVVSIDVGWQNDRTAVLRGFTIRDGGGQNYGGGVDCQSGGGILLEDLKITENDALTGGGLYCRTGAIVRRCQIFNNEAGRGAGIGFRSSRVLMMEDCLITNNRATDRGGAFCNLIEAGTSNLLLRRCLVANNRAPVISTGWFYYCAILVENSTIVDNFDPEDSSRYSSISISDPGEFTATFRNSIIYGNGENQISSSAGWTNISYCDVEEGRDSARGNIDWSEGNIDADPLFIDAQAGDYRLTEDSPCIDAGDPASPPDFDQTRTDMGAFPASFVHAWIGGRAFDSATNEPIPELTLSCEPGYTTTIFSNGVWSCPVPGRFDSTRIVLTFRADGYLPKIIDRFIQTGDSLRLDVGIDFALLRLPEEPFNAVIDSGCFERFPLTIHNIGTGPLTWQATAKSVGEAGIEPFSLRDSLLVSQITNDFWIEGVAFDGEHYYLAGGNADGQNMIYILNLAGELTGSFPQTGESRYGYRDLEWDGESLWGAGEDMIYAFNSEGVEMHSWEDPIGTITSIAFDPATGTLWMCGQTTDFYTYDREGNYLRQRIDNHDLRVYGLAWMAGDPDGANLYAVTRGGSGAAIPTIIYKINVATGDTFLVHSFPTEQGTAGLRNAFICRNFDKYANAVLLMTISRTEILGGDRLDIYQLAPNNEWFSLSSEQGIVPQGEDAEIEVTFSSASENDVWRFATGDYEGEITFTSDSREGNLILPVTMSVVEPRAVENRISPLPTALTLSSFPNPFNSSATINYSLPTPGRYAIDVIDIQGRLVTRLSDGWKEAGSYREVLNGNSISSGCNFLQLRSNNHQVIQVITLVK